MMQSIALASAIICSVLCAFFYRPSSADLAWGDMCLLLGGLALGLALWRRPAMPQDIGRLTAADRPIRPVPLALGIALLAVLAERNGFMLFYRPLIDLLDIHAQMLALVGGVALVLWGLGGWRYDDLRALVPARTRHTWAVLAVLALALAVRLIYLEDSIHTYIDEFHIIRAIGDLREQPYTALLKPFDEVATFTWVFPYLQTVATGWFGSTMSGLRLVSALLGTATTLALYLLARPLWGKTAALGAMLVLATFPPHVHFSRLALLLISDPLFGVLGLAALARALQTGERRWYVLAGGAFGLLPYFSDGGELLFPTLALAFCAWLALFNPTKPRAGGLGWLVVTALIVSAPVYYTFWAIGQPLFGRLEQAGAEGFSPLAILVSPDGASQLQIFFRERILPPLLHYVHLPDGSQIFYAGDTPLLLPLVTPLFLLGVWHALWRARGAGALLLAWVLLTALGNALLEEPTWTARYMPVAPALACFVAAGAYYTLGCAGRDGETDTKRKLFAALIITVAIVQTGYYFFQHLPRYRQQVPPWPDYVDVAYRVLDLPRETQAIMIHRPWTSGFHFPWMFRFWGASPNFVPIAGASVTEAYLLSLPPNQDYAFFVEPQDSDIVAMLASVWRLDGPYYSPYNIAQDKQYRLYWALAEARFAPPAP